MSKTIYFLVFDFFVGVDFLAAAFFGAALFVDLVVDFAAFFADFTGAATATFFREAAFLCGVPSDEPIIVKQSSNVSSLASLLPLGIL
jgi:hypothetical protein